MGNRSAPTVEHQIVSITVQLGVTTPDNLRHVGFTLEKDTSDDVSLSPTFLFDLGRVGPQQDAAGGGTRLGIGAGMRFALLDTLRFTVGYAFNPNPKPWEGRRAAFFSMEITSPFH